MNTFKTNRRQAERELANLKNDSSSIYLLIGFVSLFCTVCLLLDITCALSAGRAMPWADIGTIAIVVGILWGVMVPVCKSFEFFARRKYRQALQAEQAEDKRLTAEENRLAMAAMGGGFCVY